MRDISIDLDLQTGCLQTVVNSNFRLFSPGVDKLGRKLTTLIWELTQRAREGCEKLSKNFLYLRDRDCCYRTHNFWNSLTGHMNRDFLWFCHISQVMLSGFRWPASVCLLITQFQSSRWSRQQNYICKMSKSKQLFNTEPRGKIVLLKSIASASTQSLEGIRKVKMF